MRILIKNGMLINGENTPPVKGDLLIEDDKIVQIGMLDPKTGADKIIDATGRYVCPGFIDTHTHSDLINLVNPFNETKLRQGITTEVLGQDGISMAPLPKEFISPWRKNLAGLDGESDEIDWEYETTDNYLKMFETQGVGLNQSYLVPHGNIRMEAMGLEAKVATDDEIDKMCKITYREMEAGALGLSSGLIYIPCAYSETKELIEMCKVVAQFDGLFVVHQRSEADSIIDSMNEIINIGRQSGVKIHFSHFKICGKQNWKYLNQMISMIEEAQLEGIKISFDQYPYAAGSTMLGVVLPAWAHAGGTDKLMERLSSSTDRERMIHDIKNGIPGWDNFFEFAGADQIFVTSVRSKKNQDLIGKSLVELAEMRNSDIYNATFDLLLEEENAVGMVDFYGLESHIIQLLQRPEQNVCTDGLMSSGKPHPRAYGAFPRVIGRYTRDNPVISLELAINKMTKKAADAFNIKNRGTLKVGNFADIVIFNHETINDKGDFINPMQYPDGIDYVLVNGNLVIEHKEYHHILAGKVIRGIYLDKQ